MNNGLMISDAIGSGLKTFAQMQNIDANKQSMGLRDEQAKMQREQHSAQMRNNQQQEKINNIRMRQLTEDDQQRALGLFAKKLYAMDKGGDLSPEEQQQYLSITGGGRLTDPGYAASKEVGDALAMYPKIINGEIDKNSPEAISTYNTLINVQRGATDGRRVSINRVVPSRDGQGVHFGLNVVNADGSVNPNGVLTDNRSSDPGDPVSSVSFDELNNAYGAISNLRAMVTNPKIRQSLYREHGLGVTAVSSKDQSTIDYNKSRTNYYNSKAENERKGGGAGGTGKLPAAAQMVNFYKSMGYNDDDAVAMANDASGSPQKFVTDYSKMLIETSKNGNGDVTITPDEAFEKAMQVYSDNFKKKPKGDKSNEAKPVDIPGMTSKKPPAVRPPLKAPIQASPAALNALKNHPEKADEFKAKYGYLPEGF